jgi:hypothetical protein
MTKEKLPPLSYNWTSAVGAVIALVSVVMIVFLLIVNAVAGIKNPYLGIVLYMGLPIFLVTGLLLIPVGMYHAWRTRQKEGAITYFKWPSIDLNIRRHRNAAMIFTFGTLAFILISAVGMYQAYHYTDSVAFCGLTCHKVMTPEYSTYLDSPHARVACVECHIGPGVGWYAKSKLSGLYQVYAVLANVYPRPIKTPISNLRPARETCEQCHWPRQFFGAQQRRFNHFLYDPANTYWPINMLVKVGGGNPATAQTRGIHWHMNPQIKVEYRARDRRRQDIPWVRLTNGLTGETTLFQDVTNPLSPKDLRSGKPRIMDCIDCHNRPSHDLHSPDYAVDFALFSGVIDPGIPEIKKTAVGALAPKYTDKTDAFSKIANTVISFYRKNYPDYAEKNLAKIVNAVVATENAFSRNIFPGMNARWTGYPNNIGHFYFKGCMRCHDGNHRSDNGRVIPNDCRTCHIILSQGRKTTEETINLQQGLDFRHPIDIGGAWKGGVCYECHSGLQP